MNTESSAVVSDALASDLNPKIDRLLELARVHLGMDVSFLSEFSAGKQVYRAVNGRADDFGIILDDGPDLSTTYCQLMVAGQLPSIVPDSRADARVRSLATTRDAGIGSYIGVPLRFSDGSVYGTFCCLGRSAEALRDRDVGFLQMLADVAVEDLEAQRADSQRREVIAEAIAAESLQIALQPIMSLADGRCLGHEALARFSAGLGTPDVVFPTAHAVGLGIELEGLALRKALALLPQLPAEQYLAVNLSPLAAAEFSGHSRAVDGLDLSRVILEVTETAVVERYPEFRSRLADWRAHGLRLAIDDAGAGYASLHHIVELQPDVIKIDRSLIDGMAKDFSRRSAVRAFVGLARDLGAGTVAEGVETHADLEAARELGITAAQGYLLGRPEITPVDRSPAGV